MPIAHAQKNVSIFCLAKIGEVSGADTRGDAKGAKHVYQGVGEVYAVPAVVTKKEGNYRIGLRVDVVIRREGVNRRAVQVTREGVDLLDRIGDPFCKLLRELFVPFISMWLEVMALYLFRPSWEKSF